MSMRLEQEPTAHVGLLGLGPIAVGLAESLSAHGFRIAVWDPHEGAREDMSTRRLPGLAVTESLRELVDLVARPRRLAMVLPGGPAREEALDQLLLTLGDGDCLVDAGDTCFKVTEERQRAFADLRVALLGAGIAGGVSAARKGASIAVGGDREAYDLVRPLLEVLAARGRKRACLAWVGPGGSGHFVKMVHDAIEDAILEGLGEAFEVLRETLEGQTDAISTVLSRWQKGPLECHLLDLAIQVLEAHDSPTGRPLLDLVDDRARRRKPSRWAVAAAYEHGTPVPSFAAAIDARLLSRTRAPSDLASRAPHSRRFGPRDLVPALEGALRLNALCAFAQGFSLLRATVARWELQQSDIAQLWTNGASIRGAALNACARTLMRSPDLPNLLLHQKIAKTLEGPRIGALRALRVAHRIRVAVPVLAASLNYADGFRAYRSPQDLIQAERDALTHEGFPRREVSRP